MDCPYSKFQELSLESIIPEFRNADLIDPNLRRFTERSLALGDSADFVCMAAVLTAKHLPLAKISISKPHQP